jgi:hypothetical protein
MSQSYKAQIELWIKFALSRPDRTIFANLLDKFQTHFEKSADSIQKLQAKTTKAKGNIFEVFCQMWLLAKGYPVVYLLSEIPDAILGELGLSRNDMGIDLIAVDSNGGYSAVQCKYKLGSRYRANTLSWKTLSTFHALCGRTGPYKRHIIMTNCVGVRHVGDKSEKDQTIAFGTFNNADRAFWLKMIGCIGHKLGESKDDIQPPQIQPPQIQPPQIQPPQIQPPQIQPKLKIIAEGEKTIISAPSVSTLRELRANYFLSKLK